MKVYIVWRSNGYGNKDVEAICLDGRKAQELCESLKHKQERYDNHYYYIAYEVEK